MWIVPAKVGGNWKIDMTGSPARTYEAHFTQQFQHIGGSAKAGGKIVKFANGKLRGDTITFSIADDANTRRDFTGRVEGNRITGTVKSGGGESKFTATQLDKK
jgi:hypothetical protein